jgi:hypothetical protein
MGFMILLSTMHVNCEKTPWAYTVGEDDTNGDNSEECSSGI